MPPKKSSSPPSSKRVTAGDKRKHDDLDVKPAQAELKDQDAGKVVDDAGTKSDKQETLETDDGKGDLRPGVKDEEDAEPKAKVAKTETASSPLDWLLSDEAFNLANPEIPKGHGEVDWEDGPHKKDPPAESAGKSTSNSDTSDSQNNLPFLRYPHSHLTPFQNLIAACLLSKPFSHRLGLRTIQTLLNPPFGIRTVSDLDEAGYEGRRKIMWEARTQHKEKTAAQMGDLVEGVRKMCGGEGDEEDLSELKALEEKLGGTDDPKEAQEVVVKELTKIKGIGPGVASIFLRRVQEDWEEVYPFADDRAITAAKRFGLVSGSDSASEGKGAGAAEELAEKVGKGDRKKFVRLLDTLVGLELEKVMDEAAEKAGV